MNLQIRLAAIAENGQEQVFEIASLQRTELKLETLGLTLAEGKTILREIQRVVVERHVAECLEPYRNCSTCGQPQHGKMTIPSPRIVYCDCQPHETKSFSPLAQLLPERTTPEMLFLETKWSALMSYGVTSDLLQEVSPIDLPLSASTIREHVFRVERTNGEGTRRGAMVFLSKAASGIGTSCRHRMARSRSASMEATGAVLQLSKVGRNRVCEAPTCGS